MNIAAAIAKRAGLYGSVGKAGLHALYPDEHELYLVAFELTNYKGETLEYFIFPVMPSSLEILPTNLTSIYRTAGGITVLQDIRFNPVEIALAGNFGRGFKVLATAGNRDLVYAFNKDSLSFSNIKKQFDDSLKTGYGCCRILYRIYEEHLKLDQGRPRTLYFYNLAFNSNYIVKIQRPRFFQNQAMNMIWNYEFRLKALAPMLAFSSNQRLNKTLRGLMVGDILQKNLTRVANKGLSWVANNFKK